MKIPFFTACFIAALTTNGAQSSAIISAAPVSGVTAGGGSFQPVLSVDGRFVAFVSHANNLVTNDNHGAFLDVFLRDRLTGVTRLASAGTNGIGGGDENSVAPALSADGRFVAFQSAASNLAADDTNGLNDVFLRDLLAGTTVLVSRELTGRPSPNRATVAPLLSADGRWVVFESAATNLVVNDTNNAPDIFVFDRFSGANTFVSMNATGNGSRDGASLSPAITPDGRLVAYVNFASNTTPVMGHVYVRDIQAGTTHWASASAAAALSGYLGALNPVFSADGRFVFFHGYSANVNNLYRYDLQAALSTLVSTGAQARSLPSPSADGRFVAFERQDLVFVWDAQTGSNTPVSLTQSGAQAPYQYPARPLLTADGGKVFFLSDAGNLTIDGTNGLPQLYLRDLALGTNRLLSVSTNGRVVGDLGAVVPSITPDGSLVAFESDAASLIAGDINNATDVFLRDTAAGVTELVSAAALPSLTPAARATLYPNSVSADGRYVAYGALDGGQFPGDTNGVQDIFVRDLLNGTLEAASVSSAGAFTNRLQSVSCALSAGGRHVAYVNGPQTSGGPTAVFWRELDAGETRAISGPTVTSGFSSQSTAPAISADGRWVAYQTTKPVDHLIPSTVENNSGTDIILHDTAAGTNFLISRSITQSNRTANAASTSPLFSPDGRWLAFVSYASDVTTNVWNNRTNLFVRDLSAGVTRLASGVYDGYGGGATFSGDSRFVFYTDHSPSRQIVAFDLLARTNAVVCVSCLYPSVSADGRFVVAETLRTTIPNQVVLYDRQTGRTNRISADRFNPMLPGNLPSYAPVISADARFVAFRSYASNLDAADPSSLPNLYLRDRLLATTTALRIGRDGGLGSGPSYQPMFAADGRTLVFTSFAGDLAPGDYNERRDVFALKLAIDSDGDGLDDDWEVAFFNNLARDGSGDSDGDGQSDRTEFLSGTDPTNQGSVLRAQCVLMGAVSAVEIHWTAVAGRTYQVQYKDNLASGWLNLGPPRLAPATGNLIQVDSPQPLRFYRVQLVP